MRLWPLFIFWCLWYLNYSTRTVFAPLLPLIEDHLALSHGQAGGLLTTLSIGFCISLITAGRFAPVWGYKRTVVGGLIGIGVVVLLLQGAESYVGLHCMSFLAGIALGGYIPSIIPIITEAYEPRHWGKAIGLHDTAAGFALFTTPIFVAFGLHFFSWRRLLLFLGVAAILLPIYFWKIAVEPKKPPPQEKGHYKALLKEKTVWVVGFLWIVSNGSCNGIYSILPLYLVKEQGIDFDYANTLIGISRFGGIFASVVSGFLADRFGYRKILMLSILVTGLSTTALAFLHPLPLLVFILIFQGVVSLAFFPLALAALSRLTPPSERAMATGIAIAFGVVFGAGCTPLVLGAIADHFSFQVGILGVGMITTLSSLLVGFLKETRDAK